MLKKKRAQITIFMIVGITILFFVFFITYLNSGAQKTDNIEINPSKFTPIINLIDDCMKRTSENAIINAGLKGGYYNVPAQLATQFAAPIYFQNMAVSIPTKADVENGLSRYFVDNIKLCLGNFNLFKLQGFSFDEGDLSVETELKPGAVHFNMHYPLNITLGGKYRYASSLFKYTDNFDMLKKLDIASKIIYAVNRNPSYVPMSLMMDLAFENRLRFITDNYFDTLLVYTMLFNESSFNKPYRFSFVVRYGWAATNAAPQSNISTLQMENIPVFNLEHPTIFHYQVEATGDNISFNAYTSLFDIDPKMGLIEFDTSDLDNGIYEIPIQAVDVYGVTVTKNLILNISYPDLAPIVNPQKDLNTTVNNALQYAVEAQDPSGTGLTYELASGSGELNETTGVFTFIASSPGNYSSIINVKNQYGSLMQNIAVEVK